MYYLVLYYLLNESRATGKRNVSTTLQTPVVDQFFF